MITSYMKTAARVTKPVVAKIINIILTGMMLITGIFTALECLFGILGTGINSALATFAIMTLARASARVCRFLFRSWVDLAALYAFGSLMAGTFSLPTTVFMAVIGSALLAGWLARR